MTPDLWLGVYGMGASAMFMHLYRKTEAGWLSLLFAALWPVTALGLLVVEYIAPEVEEDTW